MVPDTRPPGFDTARRLLALGLGLDAVTQTLVASLGLTNGEASAAVVAARRTLRQT